MSATYQETAKECNRSYVLSERERSTDSISKKLTPFFDAESRKHFKEKK